MANKDVVKSVEDVVEQWRARFEASDASGMKELWDQGHAPLTYLPTERETAMTSWPDINDYYDRVCGSLKVKEWRTWDVVADVTSDTTAFAFAYTDFIYQSAAQPGAGDQYWQGRISFHLIRSDGGAWKIVHYEDSTLMQWMLPLVQEYQRPRLQAIASLVKSGEKEKALAALSALQEPIPFTELTSIAKRHS